MSQVDAVGEGEEHKFTRRGFLRAAGVFGVAAAMADARNVQASSSSPEGGVGRDTSKQPKAAKEENKEVKVLRPAILMIDTAATKREGFNIQSRPKPVEYWVDAAVGKGFGKEYLQKKTDWYRLMHTFGQHGNLVFNSIQEAWKFGGVNSEVVVEPIDQIVEENSIRRQSDELGNSQVKLELSGKKLGEIIGKYPEMKIVNLSLLLGELQLTSVKKRIEISDPPNTTYDGGKYYLYNDQGEREAEGMSKVELDKYFKENYGKMVELKQPELEINTGDEQVMLERQGQMRDLCDKFPDKLFVFAAGNSGEDWAGFVKRPKNCLVVGWGGGQIMAEGADVYVDYEDIPGQASMAVGVVSALAQMMSDRSQMPASELKESIMKLTVEKEDELNGKTYSVLTSGSIKSRLSGNLNSGQGESVALPIVLDPNATWEDSLVPIELVGNK